MNEGVEEEEGGEGGGVGSGGGPARTALAHPPR